MQLYRVVDEVAGHPVRSVYSIQNLPDYQSYEYHECSYCKQGQSIDALLNRVRTVITESSSAISASSLQNYYRLEADGGTYIMIR